jgi:Phosphodiester glycosidase
MRINSKAAGHTVVALAQSGGDRSLPPVCDAAKSSRRRLHWLALSCAGGILTTSTSGATTPAFEEVSPGVAYGHDVLPSGPVSIHIVRAERGAGLELRSLHAFNAAVGLRPVSAQVAALPPSAGRPVAAINGDFYVRMLAFAGDPRGLQITGGELLSIPEQGAAVWVDSGGSPHLDNLTMNLTASWPDGAPLKLGLNQECRWGQAALYTTQMGPTNLMDGTRDLILRRTPGSPGLKPEGSWTAQVVEVRDGGRAPIPTDGFVLSLPPDIVKKRPTPATNTVLRFTMTSTPVLTNAVEALSGGPMLIHKGRRQTIDIGDDPSYTASSMLELHPRSAMGWNDKYYYFVVVDGRRPRVSVGMTLEEFPRR